VAYAAAQLQKRSNGDTEDTRAVRAARVYLRALTSIISEPAWIDSSNSGSSPAGGRR
jgi:hypothetical protein